MSERKRCLVTGATGYVGGRLVPRLLAQGYDVRVLARSPDKLRNVPWSERVTIVTGDSSNEHSVRQALEDIDVAYYLMHSIEKGKDLETTERRVAQAFADSAHASGVGRIVYLGGLAPDESLEHMSAHMRSRVAVGQVLRDSAVPTVEFRASVIIGSGSASFEMLRYLTERLPAMVAPYWVRQQTQPIAIRDVLRYLVLAADLPPEVNRVFEIGGPDVFSYEEMMQRYAEAAGLKRRFVVPLRLLTPRLASNWVHLVTPVPKDISQPLVMSLRHPAVCTEHDVAAWIPDPEEGLLPFETAVALALEQTREGRVETRWSDAATRGAPSDPLPSDPAWAGGTLFTDVRRLSIDASPERVWEEVEALGGDNGWYAAEGLWRSLGRVDRLAGGPGNRGRRDPRALWVGDAVDVWRVEERDPPRLLRLRSEMRVARRAWLEFAIEPRPQGGCTLVQRVIYRPLALAGYAAWGTVSPFKPLVLQGMLEHIAERAEARTAGSPP